MIADEHLLVTFNKHYCSGYKHFTCTLIDEKTSIHSINEGRLYSHNGTISEYMVSSVLPAYSAKTAEPPHSSPLESSSQILYLTESPPRLSSWSGYYL